MAKKMAGRPRGREKAPGEREGRIQGVLQHNIKEAHSRSAKKRHHAKKSRGRKEKDSRPSLGT